MSKKLTGKVAVVTGASKGIGASIAKHLADEGAAVVVNYASSKQGADRVVADITSKDGKAIAVQADMSKHADIPASAVPGRSTSRPPTAFATGWRTSWSCRCAIPRAR